MGKHTELKSDPTFNFFAPPNVNLKNVSPKLKAISIFSVKCRIWKCIGYKEPHLTTNLALCENN